MSLKSKEINRCIEVNTNQILNYFLKIVLQNIILIIFMYFWLLSWQRLSSATIFKYDILWWSQCLLVSLFPNTDLLIIMGERKTAYITFTRFFPVKDICGILLFQNPNTSALKRYHTEAPRFPSGCPQQNCQYPHQHCQFLQQVM